MTAPDSCFHTASRRPASGSRRDALRRWRDGALTLAAFALVAAFVFGVPQASRPGATPALLAQAASSH